MIHYLRTILSILIVSLSYSMTLGQTNLYVSPTGDDSNSGTIGSPLKTLLGARDKVRSIKSSGIPSGGIVVNFRAGRYKVTSSTLFRPQDSGTGNKRIVYTGYQDEEVIIDGLEEVNSNAFSLATNASELHSSANGNVYVQTISDAALINLLKESKSTQMSMDDKMMTLSRFPNIGFATMNNSTINNSVETAPSTSGTSTPGTPGNPKGAKFKLLESFNASKWSAELNRTGEVYVRGYMSADWFKNTLNVNSVNGSGEIHLRDGSRYGIHDRTSEGPNRLYFGHLLCELDEPGEWYFDASNNKLYIWPFSPITSSSKIGVWAGTMVFNISTVQYMTIKKMTFQNIGKGVNGDGVVNIKDLSKHINVEGCTFRFIAAPITSVNMFKNVTDSKVLSCDFYDQQGNRMKGGNITPTSVTYGRNSFENCHFTQIFSKDFYGGVVGIFGAGNTFRNNLVHNMNGQPITFAGVDHLIERNEVFNVGVEEGDGGAIYSGNDLVSYGNVVKHNFIHHIMSVPSLLGRASIFSDDLDGGETMQENVIYKGGYEALKMNAGAGHTVTKNVVLDCYRGIRQGYGKAALYNSSVAYFANNTAHTSTAKENYIGRMLQKVGKPGWETRATEATWYDEIEPFWKNRYPFFDFAMKAYSDNNEINSFQCRYYDNMFWSNNTDIELGGSTAAGVLRSQAIHLGHFVEHDNLNLKFKSPRPSYAPNIPFESIGLYADQYRCSVPNKNDYRRAVKQHFEGQASHTNDSYNAATINDRVYYNTGKMIFSLNSCNDYFAETNFDFDMGTPTSTVAAGFTRGSNKSTPGVFGWTNTSSVFSVDRGGSNHLIKDLVYGSQTRVFEVNVPDGTYTVSLRFGDTFRHDNMNVRAEGVLKVSNLTVNANATSNQTFTTTVSDGKLSLQFSDGGGSDPNWIINRIRITPGGSTPPPPATTELSFDFGTTSSAVQSGYERVSPNTNGADFGWTNTSGLDSRDRGTSNGANALTRDIIYASTTRVFEANISNGEYQVTVTIGDSYVHNGINVKAEGVTKVSNFNHAANVYTPHVFNTTVTDGKLSLEFSDTGGSDPNWVVNSVAVVPASTVQLRFDFGTTGSVIASGYQRVSQNTSGGQFGWTNTSSLDSRDRGGSSGALNRDLVYSSQTRIFEANVPNGSYDVVVTMGDACCTHDNINVKAEGVSKISNFSSAPNSFNDQTFTTIVSDGKLSLEFSDGGGSDVNWIVNRVDITSAGSGARKELEASLENDQNNIAFYPNPFHDVLNITIPGEVDLNGATVTIYDMKGVVAKSQSIDESLSTLSLSNLNPGTYMAVVSTGEGIVRERIVKK